jgi:hypothetical protein
MIDQVMKDSSCHDPKMEAYCKEVRCLEDKFHGLELDHIARRYNEVTDELTKIASSRTTVLPDVFSRELHEPSVDLRAIGGVDRLSLDLPPEAEAPSTGADVTEGSTPPANLDPTGVFRTSTVSFKGSSHRIRLRLDRSLAGSKPL